MLVMKEGVTPCLVFEDAVPGAHLERGCQGRRFDVHQVASYSTCADSNHDQGKILPIEVARYPALRDGSLTVHAFNLS
jgi:hypothetical protein